MLRTLSAIFLLALSLCVVADQNTQAGMQEWCEAKYADHPNLIEPCLEDEIISLQTIKSYRNEWESRDAVIYTIDWCADRRLIEYGWDSVLYCIDEELFSYSALLTYQREWLKPEWLEAYIDSCVAQRLRAYGWDSVLYCVQQDVQARASTRYGVPRE